MIEDLTVQAVKIKSGFPEATLTGNYECAYAAGHICRELGIDVDEVTSRDDLETVLDKIRAASDESLSDADKNLYRMLTDFETGKTFDNQVAHLFVRGINPI